MGSVFSCFCSAFSSRSVVLGYFVAFVLPVFYRSPGCLCGVFAGSFLRLGVLPLGSLSSPSLVFLPHMVPSGTFLRPWCSSSLLCVRSVLQFLRLGSPFGVSLSLPLPCGSSSHFLSFHWILRCIPLPFSSSSFIVFCEVFFPSSCVCCVPGCCFCWRCAQGVVVLFCGVLSLEFVCVAFILSAYYPVPLGFGGGWL